MRSRQSVLVAMSGGVDSSVAAATLARDGHYVEGVTFLMLPDSGVSPEMGEEAEASSRDAEDARRAAKLLGIGHRVIDLAGDFRSKVVEPFLAAYSRGFTPVPCLSCNREVKFAALLRQADELGADAIATGHYAAVYVDSDRACLCRPADLRRDQTYFLFGLSCGTLSRLRLPLGDKRKEEVRAAAAKLGLEVAGKPASREVCFVSARGGTRTRRYLSRHLPARPGPILDSGGRRLGAHAGLHLFTVGQRRGLGISQGRPLHVLALDRERNAVVVGPADELYSASCVVEDLCLPAPLNPGEEVVVKIRSRQPGVAAKLDPMGEGRARISFAVPQRAVTPGQAAVFYAGREVLGGGMICEAERRFCRPGAPAR